jgi:hypothetical protein
MSSDPIQRTGRFDLKYERPISDLRGNGANLQLGLMRERIRCECGGIVWRSTCVCGSCGKITIVPEDGA